MANKIGVKIGLEGEKQFKNALYDINQSFKVLGSEMKLVDSAFDKNDKSVQALSARNQVLNKEIDTQKQKIETLRAALANAAQSFGENDSCTKKWQIQLNNAQAALNDMERELKENNDLLDKSDGKFDKFKGTLASIGKAAATAAAAIGAAVAAATVKLGKEVVEAYSDYEQLVGGIDTLFKESSQEMQKYAANAYKTAGMSANDYMETVTSFSASLISSLDGDTKAAVKYADMAITDMSDNTNKMGTDMQLIQNAYQGFAKQSYAMLDNLKLGYGGNKEEMQRLLADAEKLSGKKYDISSYSDIVDAIHEIQTSMGITGTTAKEAEHTISGSISALKSSLKNLIVDFGDANADIEMLCQNAADAFKNVATNITPVIQNIVKALPTAATAILKAVTDLLPILLKVVTDLFSQILDTVIMISTIAHYTERIDVDPSNISNQWNAISGETSIYQSRWPTVSGIPENYKGWMGYRPTLLSGLFTDLYSGTPEDDKKYWALFWDNDVYRKRRYGLDTGNYLGIQVFWKDGKLFYVPGICFKEGNRVYWSDVWTSSNGKIRYYPDFDHSNNGVNTDSSNMVSVVALKVNLTKNKLYAFDDEAAARTFMNHLIALKE